MTQSLVSILKSSLKLGFYTKHMFKIFVIPAYISNGKNPFSLFFFHSYPSLPLAGLMPKIAGDLWL